MVWLVSCMARQIKPWLETWCSRTPKSMPKNTPENLGKMAEKRARVFLEAEGLAFLEANFRSRYGEIDLIFLEKDTLVFVEVRARSRAKYGSALESIGYAKQQKLLKTALYYQSKYKTDCAIRFDAVAFDAGLDKIQWVRHIIES